MPRNHRTPRSSEPPTAPAAGGSRLLLVHRLVIVVLMVAVAGLSLALVRASKPPAPEAPEAPATPARIPPLHPERAGELVALDLGRRVEEFARAGWPDGSETYFSEEGASVHLHVLGYGQMVPLHVHPHGEEATIVVTGAPEILHVYGRDGARARTRAVREPGTLIDSPPLSGHKWMNHDEKHMQGNLVFSVPPFGGNLYVEEDDPRLLRGAAPSFFTPDSLLALLPPDRPFLLDPLPIMGGRMKALILRGACELPAASGKRVIYVARGGIALPAAGGSQVGARCLLELPAGQGLRMRALGPTVAYVFAPTGSS